MKLFITGTDTGVGKTWISAALARQAIESGLRVVYYKPVQTGTPKGEPPEDAHFIQSVLGNQVQVACRYCFEPPVTPAVADPEQTIQTGQILQDVDELAAKADVLLVEGAGGLAVPVSPTLLMIDLIQSLNIPVVLVARSRLGTINHTLLSVEALQRRGIPIAGIVANFYPEEPEEAELCVSTLIPMLRHFIPQDIPIWTAPELQNASAPPPAIGSTLFQTQLALM